MTFIDPPALPDFIAPMLPFERRAWRFEEGIEAGRMMHLIDCGPRDGRVVWMQHGNPTWSFLWRKVIGPLSARGYRCVAPDLLGFGLSSKLPSIADHGLARHVDSLAVLLEALEVDAITLAGQDWGGPMITGLGARFPDRICGVVLGNTSVLAPSRPRGTAFHRFARAPLISDLVFRGLGLPQAALWSAQGDRGSIRGEVSKAYRWPLRRLKDRSGPLALARMVPDSLDHPSMGPIRAGEGWLKGFAGPMELVWGERDPILGQIAGRHEAAFPEAPMTRTQAGHFLQEEVPDDLVAAIERVCERGRA